MAPQTTPADNRRQLQSQTYQLAALDQDFILGESTRGIRLQLEYTKVEEALRAWGVRSTVVVFGSARVNEKWPAQTRGLVPASSGICSYRLGMRRRQDGQWFSQGQRDCNRRRAGLDGSR
jgi:hypothetical protein